MNLADPPGCRGPSGILWLDGILQGPLDGPWGALLMILSLLAPALMAAFSGTNLGRFIPAASVFLLLVLCIVLIAVRPPFLVELDAQLFLIAWAGVALVSLVTALGLFRVSIKSGALSIWAVVVGVSLFFGRSLINCMY